MSLDKQIKTLRKQNISFDAAVLAGGQGSRMSGRDKGLILFDGEPMARHTIRILAPIASNHQVLINCNRNVEAYRNLSPRICQDISIGYQGPLAGIEAVLSSSEADVVFIMPCDTPFADKSIIELIAGKLIETAMRSEHFRPIALQSGEQKHPLHCCIPRSYLPSVQSSLQTGRHKLMQWFDENDAIWLDFDHGQALNNINTPKQLSSAAFPSQRT